MAVTARQSPACSSGRRGALVNRPHGSESRPSASMRGAPTPVPPRPGRHGRPPAGRPAPQPRRPNNGGRSSRAVWEARRGRNRLLAGGAVTLVVLVVVALIAVKLGSGTASGAPRVPAPVAAVAKLTSIPLSTLTGAA